MGGVPLHNQAAGLKAGRWIVFCQRCRGKYWNDKLRLESWSRLHVCEPCYLHFKREDRPPSLGSLQESVGLYPENATVYFNNYGTGLTSYDTHLTADALPGATSISVQSSSGMLNGQNIFITTDNEGSQFITTITNVAGTTISLASPLPSQASSGNDVLAN
jgi:hypothetical protein